MPVQALLFDLDDTLVVDEAVTKETFMATAELATTYGVEAATFAKDATALSQQLWKDSPVYAYCRGIGISARECLWGNFSPDIEAERELAEWSIPFRVEVFDRALRVQMLEHADAAAKLATFFAAHRRKLQRLMPDALEVLTRLKDGYRLGMLTNGASSLQREKIAASGVEGFFDAILVSGEAGIGKPNPAVFRLLCERLGCVPEEAVMVGNSKERDIAGANAANISAVWLEVAGAEEDFPCKPDHVIRSLSMLPDLLPSAAA